jgi:hypothetical protein
MLLEILRRIQAETPGFFVVIRYISLVVFLLAGAVLLAEQYHFYVLLPNHKAFFNMIGSNSTTIFLMSFLPKKKDE